MLWFEKGWVISTWGSTKIVSILLAIFQFMYNDKKNLYCTLQTPPSPDWRQPFSPLPTCRTCIAHASQHDPMGDFWRLILPSLVPQIGARTLTLCNPLAPSKVPGDWQVFNKHWTMARGSGMHQKYLYQNQLPTAPASCRGIAFKTGSMISFSHV